MRPLLLACAFLALGSSAARAQSSDVRQPGAPWLSSLDSPRATAMGGAHAAVATGNDALFVNPAGLAQVRRYHFEGDGILDTRFPAQGLLMTVADNATGPVASGLVYAHWGSGRDEGRAQGWLGGVAYAYNTGSFYFGGLTKYWHFNVPTSGDSNAPDGSIRQFAQDFGLLARRGDFSYALVVQNLALSTHPLLPLTGTAAVQWGSDTGSHLAFDYKADLTDTSHVKHKLAAGYELLLDAFALRAGGTYDLTNSLWWISAGVGILTEKGGVQVVYRRKLSDGLDNVFMAGFTLYLE